MKILFCTIAWMKYYQGIWPGDQPKYGGPWVTESSDANECFNFQPMDVAFRDAKYQSGEYCLGFYETKSTRLEKISGNNTKSDMLSNVLVVWCAPVKPDQTVVVGWYKNATVCRNYRALTISEDNEEMEIIFNVFAKSANCVLLPDSVRSKPVWRAPRIEVDGYGFGTSNVWHPQADAEDYISRITESIHSYKAKNWTGLDLSELD